MSSNNHFVFDGLEELKAELRALPAELKGEATEIVMDAASRAKADVGAVYAAHRRSGNLAAGLTMAVLSIGPFGVAVEVRSRAPHAWLFDNGSQARHYITVRGSRTHKTGAMWSKSPPRHIFAASMARARRQMHEQLRDLLERHGLVVTGQAA